MTPGWAPPPAKAASICIRSWAGPSRPRFFSFWQESRCPGNGKIADERSDADADRPLNDSPRRGNLRLWPALSLPGIRHRLGMVAESRPAPRRYPQHDRRFHDADGRPVLDHKLTFRYRKDGSEKYRG